MTEPLRPMRLAELIASLSLATDLGLGQPQEHVLRQTVLATRLADAAGLSDADRAAAYYVSLLAWVGCVADSPEMAHWYGDDLRIRADSYGVDKAGLPMMTFLLGHLATGGSALRRISVTSRFLAGGVRDSMDSFLTHCRTAADIAERLELPTAVRTALPQAFERWDGHGVPAGLRGDAIIPVMRVVHIADDAEVHARVGGVDAAMQMLRSRRGTEFDPGLVDLCIRDGGALLDGLDQVDAWQHVIDGCAALDRPIPEAELTEVLAVFADYADAKATWFLGHSRAVAELAAAAAREYGLPADQATTVRRAALVCRLGTIGVSTGIWNKPGPLTPSERERVRMVPYLTERVLARSPYLAVLAGPASMVYERMDGSGYPRGLTGAMLPPTARILAAAQMLRALGEDRPHRPAADPDERAKILRAEVTAGRLDGDAVAAVLAAAQGRRPRKRAQVAGLTARELDVLTLLVRGRSTREIAQALGISPRTAGSHVEHIYTKIGVHSRGSAAVFAMRHGLLPDEDQPAKIG
ncbi:HD domain-containing phosphohydrolase [Nocardia rhizosphaerihabitans]|uniref:HD domain-containing phosphohydrolase n=1 Tax=Nocardia rhizosphaerihabitans TaxID=1691570 RepID=UPI00366DC788